MSEATSASPSPYEVLGLAEVAAEAAAALVAAGRGRGETPLVPEDDVRTAYRRQALRLHPDKNRHLPPAVATAQFDALTKALEALTDPSTRATADAALVAHAERAAREEARSAHARALRDDLERREREESQRRAHTDAQGAMDERIRNVRIQDGAFFARLRREQAAAHAAAAAAAAANAAAHAASSTVEPYDSYEARILAAYTSRFGAAPPATPVNLDS